MHAPLDKPPLPKASLTLFAREDQLSYVTSPLVEHDVAGKCHVVILSMRVACFRGFKIAMPTVQSAVFHSFRQSRAPRQPLTRLCSTLLAGHWVPQQTRCAYLLQRNQVYKVPSSNATTPNPHATSFPTITSMLKHSHPQAPAMQAHTHAMHSKLHNSRNFTTRS